MDVDFPATAASFNDLPPGGFFMLNRRRPEYGLCVSDGNTNRAIIFSRSEQDAPLFLTGGPLNDTLISYRDAVIRPDLHSVLFTKSDGMDGAIISASGNFYLRVLENLGYRTFNIRTGNLEAPNEDAKSFILTRWQVGLVIDEQFVPVFTFPAPGSSQMIG
jgi:hypothetical protein